MRTRHPLTCSLLLATSLAAQGPGTDSVDADQHAATGTVPVVAVAPGAARSEGRRSSVRFVLEVRNTGKAPLRDLVLRLLLPRTDLRQEVELCELAEGAKRVRDGYGNELAELRATTLAPGDSLRAQWFATVRLRSWDGDRHLASVRAQAEGGEGGGQETPTLSPAERRLYLADAPVYVLTDPRIRELSERCCEGLEDPLAKVRALHGAVIERLRYVRDGKWDPAPLCLERGQGSCSEYAYCFVALARAAGLPARWAGGLSLRDPGAPLYEDKVFHRWAEVWLPDRGWYAVDCSRDDGEDARGRRKRPRLGRVGQDLLVLMKGDGGEQSLTRFNYHSSRTWRGRGGKADRAGYWTRPVSAAELGALRARAPEAGAPEDPGLRQAWRFLHGQGLEPANGEAAVGAGGR